jgi:hypothetical protein
METRTIGALTVSVVGLGCNNFGRRVDEAGTQRVVDAALDAGVTFLDTADIYGGTASETFLGRILRRRDRSCRDQVRDGGRSDKVGAAPTVRRALHDSLSGCRPIASIYTNCISPTRPCRRGHARGARRGRSRGSCEIGARTLGSAAREAAEPLPGGARS